VLGKKGDEDDKYTFIRTHNPDHKDIHGGGRGLEGPYASRQGWRPTFGCIRMQNEEIDDLSRRILNYKKEHGHAPVPFRSERH
jgi:hypothetical protein